MLTTYYKPDDSRIITLERSAETGIVLGIGRTWPVPAPGDEVRHTDDKRSRGILIAKCDEYVVVLWSHPPETIFTLPNVRRVFPSAIATQLVQVQPMTVPVGNVFYVDHTYGSGSRP